MLSLIHPTLRWLRQLGHLVWALFNRAWETLVWGSVRAGSVSLAGAAPSFRWLIRLGLWLTIASLVMLLFGDAWRRASPLVPLLFHSDALAGLYAPQLFVPVALGLLSLAWAYLLCGALHAHWAAKGLVLFLFGLFEIGLLLNVLVGLLTEIGLLLSGLPFSLWGMLTIGLHLGGWLALLSLLAFRWRRPIRLGLEFPLTLFIVAGLLFSAYFGARLSTGIFQFEAAATAQQLTQALELIGVFLTPFLLMVGAEVAAFGMNITQAVAGRLRRSPSLKRTGGLRWWALALAAGLSVRLAVQWIAPLVRGAEPTFSWGAVVTVTILGLMFLRLMGRASIGDLPGWVIPAAALTLYAVLLVLQIAGFVGFVLASVVISLGSSGEVILNTISRLFGFLGLWNELFVSGLALWAALGLWLRARRQRRPLPGAALYGLIFGVWLLWWVFTRPGRPLGALAFRYEHLSAMTTPVLLGILLVAALARRLTPNTLLYLTGAALLFWLLEFQDFLSDPLSPAFTLLGAQAVFVSVSIFLNVMAAGNRFALNAETARFPRYTRALLYIGYALLTATTMNWLAAAHDVNALATNELITQNGYLVIGLPLAFWALLTGSETVYGVNS